jgi:hypothetical protein
VVNGTLAALHSNQSRYLTIRGFGIFGKKPNRWFVDVHNGTGDPGGAGAFKIKAVGFLICQRR